MRNFDELYYLEQPYIEHINNIVINHPVSWNYIADAIEEAVPLLDYLGPDGLLIAVINEKKRRYLDES